MLPNVINPNALELSWLDWLDEDEKERQRQILRARAYFDGEHPVYLTDRLRQFLGLQRDDETFRFNLCRLVVQAVCERTLVAGFDSPDQASAEWAHELWRVARMASRMSAVHEQAARDGESFLVVDWDTARARPRFTPHERYTSTEVDGEGYGCQMCYPDDDVSQEPEYALKRWSEAVMDERGRRSVQQRATFYYPDRVEKYGYGGAGWMPLQDEGDAAWPLPWVDSSGAPLGIPVFHFQNPELRPEAEDAIPLQDALNKTLVDLVAAADSTAFRMYTAFGWVPTTDGQPLADDGSNALSIAPGMIVGTTKAPSEASFAAIESADLTQLRELKQDLVLDLAAVTNTPAHRFQTTKAVAAEGTLKQREEPLMAKIRDRQTRWGEAWEMSVDMARKLANLYGGAGLDETAAFTARWEDSSARSDADRYAEWDAKQKAGIPKRQLWAEMGYTPEQVEQMLGEPEIKLGTFAAYP